MPRFAILLALLLCHVRLTRADSTVVFNEVMYHPSVNETTMEWVELFNPMSVDVDISGWSLANGVDYTFAEGTILGGGKYLVVSIAPEDLKAATGQTNILGPFSGRLSNSGETLELRSNNLRLMDELRYQADGDWPVGPDGAGFSLAKLDPNSGSGLAANWTASKEPGGTPGKANFPSGKSSPSPLAFNEIASSVAAPFWVEILNTSGSTISLDGNIVALSGSANAAFTFPAGRSIGAGEFIAVDQAELGFRPKSGDQLFLLSAQSSLLFDAVTVKKTPRARYPQGTGAWLNPSAATPGAANQFALHDEVVINEIMYRHYPAPPAAAGTLHKTLVPMDAVWRYQQKNSALPPNWNQASFDDSSWPQGNALLYVEDAALPGPKNTPLSLGGVTYYFRTEFNFSGNPAGLQLFLSWIVDDGAIFYLNGQELKRFNMADGPVTYDTFASIGVADAVLTGPVSVPATGIVQGRNVLAAEVHQGAISSSDVVFGVLLEDDEQIAPAPSAADEQWVELHNRTANPVDLTGWQLDGGVHYDFPAASSIPPNGFLVVTKDTNALAKTYPDIPILGNFTGSLSSSHDTVILRDPLKNPANQVGYYDSRPWPDLADGGGSTLELKDPWADNSKPEAWAASDESRRSEWQQVVYEGVAGTDYGPSLWHEFVLGLIDAGEALIDDLQVVENPATTAVQLIQNGNFESGMASWRALGTHRLSEVIVDPSNPANHVLRLVATGPMEHMHNHLETTLANNLAVVAGRTYRISFRARWLAGSNQLNTRLYFNRVARTTLLNVPSLNGTPGRANSRLAPNLGPTFQHLQHSPTVPLATQPVNVSVEASANHGVQQCLLWWSQNGGAFASIPMAAVANSPTPNLYTALLPARPASTLVQFYIEATDTLGTKQFYPAEGPASRAMYKVNDSQAALGKLHNLRLIMTTTDANLLHSVTNVQSNESLRGTFIYDEKDVFYDIGVHLQGSERGRSDDSRVGFTLEFHPDQLFRGVHNSLTVDRSGGYSGRGGKQDEIVIRHVMNHAGGSLPSMHNDLVRFIAPRSTHTGAGMLLMAKYGGDFLDSSYKNGSKGPQFKIELAYSPLTTLDGKPQSVKLPQPDDVVGVDLQDLGNDSETYRWFFLEENNRRQDDYRPLIALAKSFELTGAAFESKIQQLADVDQWMRSFALKTLSGDVDTYGYGYTHNEIFYFRPEDGRALAFPWDMDFSWTRGATDTIYPGSRVSALTGITPYRRLFLGHLLDILTTTYNTTYMSRWTAHYGSLVSQSYSGILSYIGQRATYVRTQLPAKTAFGVTSTGGSDIVTNAANITLTGNAWIDVKSIRLAGTPTDLPVTWSTVTQWKTTLPLRYGANSFVFLGIGYNGQTVATNTVNVASTALAGRVDSDKDGLPDEWETLYGLNPLAADADADADGDGMTNLQEYLAGTDPLDPRSLFGLSSAKAAPDQITLGFSAQAARTYTIQQKPMISAGWAKVASVGPFATNQMFLTNLTINAAVPSQYFRVVTP